MENYEKNSRKLKSTRSKILECALALIQKYGYGNVTIQQICKEASITKSTFYYHFQSKEHLLEDFTNQVGYIIEDNYSNILLQDSYTKQLWELLKVYFIKDKEVGSEITKQVFISHLENADQKNFPHSTYAWNMVMNLIDKAKNAGEILNPLSADEIGEAVYAASRGCCVTWSIENGDFDLADRCRKIINTILMPSEDFMIKE